MSPAQLHSLLQQGIVHHRAGRFAEAQAAYARVRSVAPRNFDAVHLSGVVALQQGRAAEAIDLLTRALKLNPESAVCTMRLGLAHLQAGQAPRAEPMLRRALELDPKMTEAWDNLALCLKIQDRLKQAVECHQRAIELAPRNANSWYNYGLTLSLYGRSVEALACHERALSVDPGYHKAHFGLAQTLQQLDRVKEAVAAYDVFLEKEPANLEARSYRLFALNYLENLPPARVLADHVRYGEVVGTFPEPEFAQEPDPARRLRVGILSPDLRAHSCAYFIEPLIRHLAPEEFEVFLYHDHFREDAVSQRLRTLVNGHWRNFIGQPNALVEPVIRRDRPDILIDLAGHTGMTNRLAIFARHLAPVQITYLGYPNTTGLPAIGYRFTDDVADPPGEADTFATEKLVRFAPTAWAYQPAEQAPAPNEPPCLAAGAGVTFGCFNNLAKINDPVLRCWSGILAAVPGSRLLLKGRGLSDAAVRERYRERLVRTGLDPERVDLLESTPEPKEHLALYHRVDVALDTFPYNGTTTTCEALWMGCPVVTVPGDRHAARVGASLLRAVGRREWIAADRPDYVRIAVELAADRERLRAVRAGLRDELRASALLDHAGQAARFAAALRTCWRAWCESRVVPGTVASSA